MNTLFDKKHLTPEEEIKYILLTFVLCQGDPQCYDSIKEEVLSAEMSGAEKNDFFILLESKTWLEWEQNAQRLLYDVFHAETVCRMLKKTEVTEEQVKDSIASLFSTYLREYGEEEREAVIKAVLDEDKRRRH